MYKSVLLGAFIAISSQVVAADRYYVGPANGVWSNPNNWSATAGGPGGAGAPQVNDRVFVQPAIATTIAYDGALQELSQLSLNGSSAPLTINQTTNTPLGVSSTYTLGPGLTYNQSAGNNYAINS